MFQSDRDGDRGLFWQPVNGGEATRLTKPKAGEAHEPESWSANGDTLLFSVTKGSDVSLWMLSLTDKKSAPFGDVHSSTRTGAVFSPDGRWVAYATTEGSTTTIYVQPFPAIPGVKHQLLPRGGQPKHPVWSAAQSNSSTIRAPVSSSPSASRRCRPSRSGTRWQCRAHFPELPQAFEDRTTSPQMAGLCLLSPPDNRRPEGPQAPQIQVVLNWFEELKTRAPTR